MLAQALRLTCATIGAVVVLCVSVVAHVYTVDENNPSADFQHVQVAIDSVEDGATLLIQSDLTMGYYYQNEVVRVWQNVTLIGDKIPKPKFVKMGLWIDTPGITVALRDLEVTTNFYYNAIEWAKGGDGRLFVDGCRIEGEGDHKGIELHDLLALFTECELVGGHGEPGNASVIYAEDSFVFFNRCHIVSDYWGTLLGGRYHQSETLIEGRSLSKAEPLQQVVLQVPQLDINSKIAFSWFADPDDFVLVAFGVKTVAAVDPDFPWIVIPEVVFPLRTGYEGAGSWSSAVPDDAALIGVPVVCQAFDAETGSVSCPLVRVIGG